MMGKGSARNMLSFYDKIKFWEIRASGWFLLKRRSVNVCVFVPVCKEYIYRMLYSI